ncbi:15-cis-phytoene synthase [Parasulfitobacter algicola]|uniref:Phytoene/squalene synthase family protein n=1 Tax=Parasulfitobacter algicola TaxID=2614809 RepID=A0ABX2ITG9_9RHOB|nr:phytoene/squalene synthase family protein [Sulfitobacter algicola]NSX53348.1 phytoene/squalene synthase family protein [Sulfitobacter algicola]
MIAPDDLEYCKKMIQTGSLSFHAASKLLPTHVRDPALALYAFCRLADDAVDMNSAKASAVLSLRDRLQLVYDGRPQNTPTDRAFAAVVEDFQLPRALPEALLEGLAWDACERRYDTLSDLFGYSARVASSVGVMMCVLMGVRDANALARACDLGLAMQLTNIARDVGEDAREGRIYLPMDWVKDAGIDPDVFFIDPLPTDPVRAMVRRLLVEADRLYIKAQTGISALPLTARTGIMAARLIYAGIGAQIRKNGYDSISMRATTSKYQKYSWIAQAGLFSGVASVMPRSAVIYARPQDEVRFLVDATAQTSQTQTAWGEGKTGTVLTVLAELKMRERSQQLQQ